MMRDALSSQQVNLDDDDVQIRFKGSSSKVAGAIDDDGIMPEVTAEVVTQVREFLQQPVSHIIMFEPNTCAHALSRCANGCNGS